MTYRQKPRYLSSAFVEERDGSVTVTLGLGDEIPSDAELFGYGVDCYGPDGHQGKRFGVRFGSDGAAALIYEWLSATQANAGHITYLEDGVVVTYPDASLGMDEIGAIHAFTHVNGNDVQTGQQVTVVRY